MALHEKTEGWAAAVQIVASALAGADEQGARRYVERLSGVQRHIFAYLAEEVFRRHPPARQDFLMRTAVLVQMDAVICNALAGCRQRAGSAGRAGSRESLSGQPGRGACLVSLSPSLPRVSAGAPGTRTARPAARAGTRRGPLLRSTGRAGSRVRSFSARQGCRCGLPRPDRAGPGVPGARAHRGAPALSGRVTGRGPAQVAGTHAECGDCPAPAGPTGAGNRSLRRGTPRLCRPG